MAKKKSAKKKSSKKPVAKKRRRNGKGVVSPAAAKSSPTLKALASVKALGAKAVVVHFHGAGDDGWYEYRVISNNTKRPLQLSAAAEDEVNRFLSTNFRHYGEGPGSVLLARFDLVHAVCHGYSGSGDPGARLAELISFCEWHGAKKIVGTLRSGKFSQCKVVPSSALAREEASNAVHRFLELTREYAAEYGEYDEEEGYDGEEYALLDAADGTLVIDIAERWVTLTQSRASKSIEIAVDRLIETSLPLRLA
jgi:hypothetical protein